MLDVSGAAVLQAALPSCQVDLLDDCGHSVALERPRKAAKLITDFLSAQELSGKDDKKYSWIKLLNRTPTPDLRLDMEGEERDCYDGDDEDNVEVNDGRNDYGDDTLL